MTKQALEDGSNTRYGITLSILILCSALGVEWLDRFMASPFGGGRVFLWMLALTWLIFTAVLLFVWFFGGRCPGCDRSIGPYSGIPPHYCLYCATLLVDASGRSPGPPKQVLLTLLNEPRCRKLGYQLWIMALLAYVITLVAVLSSWLTPAWTYLREIAPGELLWLFMGLFGMAGLYLMTNSKLQWSWLLGLFLFIVAALCFFGIPWRTRGY